MILTKVPRFCLSPLRNFQPLRATTSQYYALMSRNTLSTDIERKTTATEQRDHVYQTSIPQHHLSYLDKVTLKLFGNIKGEIPSEVSYPVMEKADSKRRIAINLFLIAFCGFGSMFVVYNVKKNLKNNTQQNIYTQNSDRYQQDKN